MPDKPRLLLVDDDTVALQVISKALAPYARLRFARSGAEALKAIEADLPDLLILDVNMPGLGGIEVLTRLRGQAASAQLPVILITGAEDEALEATALELGAQDFIRKPFQPELLVERMRALLRLAALRSPTPRAGAIQPWQGAHILLVDDDALSIEAMRSALEPLGAQLATASDGEMALARMREAVPDLVMLDAEMPRLDGYAVCQAMQLDPVLAQVPVAFVSVHAEAKFETLSFAVGASDFLAKPFKPEVLVARVRKLLSHRHERDESTSALAAHWQELGERRVAELVAVASDAIVSVDANGLVRLMNKAAAALFGVSIDRALGQDAEAVLPGWMALSFASESMVTANDRRRMGRPARSFRLCRGDGEARTVEPIVFQQGSGPHLVTTVVLRDATDRIAAEQRREARRDRVVASAIQLSLLLALAQGERSAEAWIRAMQGDLRLPLPPPTLDEYDLVQALDPVAAWGQDRSDRLQLTWILPKRSLPVMGNASALVLGLQGLLATASESCAHRLDVEVSIVVGEEVMLILSLPDQLELESQKTSAAWQLATTQLCAGGAVCDDDGLETSNRLRFVLLRALSPLTVDSSG